MLTALGTLCFLTKLTILLVLKSKIQIQRRWKQEQRLVSRELLMISKFTTFNCKHFYPDLFENSGFFQFRSWSWSQKAWYVTAVQCTYIQSLTAFDSKSASVVDTVSINHFLLLRHPQILTVQHPLEESRDCLAFATEPVLASLANVLGGKNLLSRTHSENQC